jgi:cell wall-associated NlpC family hydrolase
MTDLERLQRAAVIAETYSWENTPYHDRGRIKGVGVDCAMLPAEIYEAVKLIPRVEPEYYPPDWHFHRGGERYISVVEKYARIVVAPLPGDLALYRFGRNFAHGAIVIDWPLIVHAVREIGVTEADGDGLDLRQTHHGAPRPRLFYRLNQWAA